MQERTIVLIGGDELDVGRGPNIDGLVWFQWISAESDSAGVKRGLEFAMDEAAARVLIVTLQEAVGEIHATRPSDVGQMRLGEPVERGFAESRALARVLS